MFINAKSKILLACSGLKKKALSLASDVRGAEFVQILIAILIVIIVGGIIVAILRIATPDLVNDTITRIRTIFEL